MTIDENHPSVRRLVDKIVQERFDAALDNFLKGVDPTVGLGSVMIPAEDDTVEMARFEGWKVGMQQGYDQFLHLIRHRIKSLGGA